MRPRLLSTCLMDCLEASGRHAKRSGLNLPTHPKKGQVIIMGHGRGEEKARRHRVLDLCLCDWGSCCRAGVCFSAPDRRCRESPFLEKAGDLPRRLEQPSKNLEDRGEHHRNCPYLSLGLGGGPGIRVPFFVLNRHDY